MFTHIPRLLKLAGLMLEWTLATLFVFATALIWSLRFRTGAWRRNGC